MAEQQVHAARRAEWRHANVLLRHPGIQQLTPVRLQQVQPDLLWQFTVSRRPRRQKQQRILLSHLVLLLRLPKQLASISKLRLEFVTNFLPNVVATVMHPRPDRGHHVPRQRSKMPSHLADAFLDDTFYRSSPSRMKHSHRASFSVHQDHWQTIRRLNRQRNPGRLRDQPISNQMVLRYASHAMNQIRMHLPECDDRPRNTLRRSSQLFEKHRPIPFHCRPRIVLGKSQVKVVLAIRSRTPAHARRKTSNHPRKFQIAGSQNLQAVVSDGFPSGPFAQHFRRHGFMIATVILAT